MNILRDKWPCSRRAAKQRDELAALHGCPLRGSGPDIIIPLRKNAPVHHSKLRADVADGSFASDMIVRIQRGISASPPKRTNWQMSRYVRLVPGTDICTAANRILSRSSALPRPTQINAIWRALPKRMLEENARRRGRHDDPRRRDRGKPLARAPRRRLPPPPHRYAGRGGGRACKATGHPGLESQKGQQHVVPLAGKVGKIGGAQLICYP